MPTVRVDPDRCYANEDCARAAPGLFHLDDGVAAFSPGEQPYSVKDLQRAARACPTQAITVVADDEKD